jgi:glycosyltransferase involved in cell wall biosynthesis
VYEKLAKWAKEAGIPSSRIEVIENAIDLDRIRKCQPLDLRKEFKIAPGRRCGVVVAGLRSEKGILELIEIMPQLSDRCAVIIIGEEREAGYWNRCQSAISGKGLKDTVILAGARKDAPRIMRSADFGIIPSLSESGPLVLIEYIAAELPFVCTTTGAIATRVAAMNVPGFVPPGHSAKMAQEIGTLLSLSAEQRIKRITAASAAVREFDISYVANRWYQTYSAAIGRMAA